MATQSPQRDSTIAAIFDDEHDARQAVRALEQFGFHHAWPGVVSTANETNPCPVVDKATGGGLFETIGRMFGGEGDRSLQAVLSDHG